jgi:hypothetical protein
MDRREFSGLERTTRLIVKNADQAKDENFKRR